MPIIGELEKKAYHETRNCSVSIDTGKIGIENATSCVSSQRHVFPCFFNAIEVIMSCHVTVASDSFKRFGDSRRRRCRLLSCVECDSVSDQCRRCQSIDPPSGSDHTEEHSRDKDSQRNSLGQRKHQSLHAGMPICCSPINSNHFNK